ncbi:MAG: NnrS family protein [Sinobacteraceae bacterium]|nr:NnrS family protein [Nevskiaceae bacterium]MCP5359489.1 NnrS family protein [Nevskiaceae bacterium]MCP5466832.1 NnrS family protein [Nevskiaceae bacterium]MCP5470921.1 NnrS family protein [Nevskiaceae bacterium]
MRPFWKLPVFACGFRSLFLAGALFAALAIPAWIGLYTTGQASWGELPAQLWHGHEMLFGFGLAAVGGFLLTAVPNWTGTPFRNGLPLALLALSWCAARLLIALGPGPTWPLAVLLDLAFLPGVAVLIAPPLLRTGNRNIVLVVALAVIWACDVAFFWAAIHADVATASRMLVVTLDLLLILITVVGGRIIPAFTANALRRRGGTVALRSSAWLEHSLPVAMVLLAVLDALAPFGMASGWLAALLALAHAWRLAGWQGLQTRREPILWSLHLAYAWLPLGLALKAVWLLSGASLGSHWMHALGAGAIASVIFAVITRVALGHTGRPLVVRPLIAWAYLLLHLGAFVRVVLPPALPGHYAAVLAVAAAAWTLAFVAFLIVYAPILLAGRPDNQPG